MRAVLILCVSVLAACSEPPGSASNEGVLRYGELCASCHGQDGQGLSGPSLRDWSRGRDELVAIIDARMPLGEPEKCTGRCAEDIADYILAKLTGPITCEGAVAPGARKLRLLTRREYAATVADLLGGGGGACPPHRFTYTPASGSPQTVHVAGSFNGWPQTIAGGGWPLKESGGTWTLERALPAGTHTYKFVLDEKDWIVDPANPNRQSDGYGGENSVVTVACQAGGLPDVAAKLPVETRPDGFPFDNEADAQSVTSVHVEAYLAAARELAEGPGRKLSQCAAGDGACLEAFVRDFGRRAFRRPLTDAEQARYRALAGTDPMLAVQAMLSSPHFLYRSEMGTAQADGTYRLTGYELASALSYTLWGTMPDATLLDAAERGELDTPDGLSSQARRLLDDPRARDAIGRFALMWLGAENVLTADKKPDLFPGFEALRGALAEETRRFVAHVVFDGTHRFDELFTADYTFVDAQLASLYEMPAPQGSGLQRASYAGAPRSGLLGHGSVLASTSHSDQSSPIRRGLFVRRRLLCQELPPPPPNAGGVPEVDPNATTRERFRQHTDNPFCASCHQYIDGVGFGFERFDAIGRFRTTENGQPIDATGDMNDVERLGVGTHAPFSSLPDLAKILVASETPKQCFARRYTQFVRGLKQAGEDACGLNPIVERFRASGWDLRELMLAVVESPAFVVRQ